MTLPTRRHPREDNVEAVVSAGAFESGAARNASWRPIVKLS